MSKLSNDIDIQLFKTFESLLNAIKIKEPDIIGCSWIGWSHYLTTNALKYIKSKFPNITTVVGGVNVSEKNDGILRDFKKYPFIDIMIPKDGEIPFVNLLNVFIKGGKELVFKTAIDGVYYLSEKNKVIIGNIIPLTKNINIFPSPYLSGILDQFINMDELIPILQSSRGCPYHCSYCVAGKNSWNKIRLFDIERVKEEINYLDKNAKSRTIIFTDENIGIVPRDIEIAKFIAKKRKETGYPSSLRVYTHTRIINDRIKKIILLLKDLIPMNISVQTLTDSVLKNINRKNIDLDKFYDVVNWAHKNNINATTEAIFGLPGETYDSFMDMINKFIDMHLDSIAFGPILLLKETELARPESIDKYGYKVLYGIGERGYTKFNKFENIEIETYAVENYYYSFEDYIKIRLFESIFRLFMFLGYFKEMAYMWQNRNMKITDVISEILENKKYPFFYQRINRLKKCIKDNLFETKDQAHEAFSKRFSDNTSGYIGFMKPNILIFIILGEMIHPKNQSKLIDEIIKASTVIFNKSGSGSLNDFSDEMQFGKILVKNIIIPFWETPKEIISLTSPYNLISWREKEYRGNLSEFTLSKPTEYQFKINSISQYNEFIYENSKKPFYLQSELFFKSFRTINVRRFIISK